MEVGEIKQDPQLKAMADIVMHLDGIEAAVTSVEGAERDELMRLVRPRATRTLKALVPAKASRNGRRARA